MKTCTGQILLDIMSENGGQIKNKIVFALTWFTVCKKVLISSMKNETHGIWGSNMRGI